MISAEAPSPCYPGIAPERDPQCGVADGTGHNHAVPGLCAGTAQHLAMRHRAEHRNRDRDRTGGTIGVTPEERTAEEIRVVTQAPGKGR